MVIQQLLLMVLLYVVTGWSKSLIKHLKSLSTELFLQIYEITLPTYNKLSVVNTQIIYTDVNGNEKEVSTKEQFKSIN